MDIKKELEEQTKRDEEEFMRIEACSTMDCTGLMSIPPLDDAEAEAYDEIYNYNPERYYDYQKMKKDDEDKK